MDNSPEQNIQKEIEEPYSNVLYVADLPNETTNEDLQKFFKDYHFHYASLNNYKNNQTWAQVYLENKEWATRARHELNGNIIKPMNGANSIKEGKPVRICKYEGKGQNKQTNIKQSLLVKNIDCQMSQKEFYQKFLEFGDIVSGKIEYDENGISKGFGYIYYTNEDSAENAKKNLNGKYFYGKAIEIVNLIPGKKTKSNAITLFVLNIPNNISEKQLIEIFGKYGPVSNVSVNQRGFAYISYANFEGATKCLKEMKSNPISFQGLPNVVVKFASSKEERDARLDIRYKKASKRHVIVELKRGDRVVKSDELFSQIMKYQSAMTKILKDYNMVDESFEIIVLLGKHLDGDNYDQKVYEDRIAALAKINARILMYDELLRNAESLYRDYLDKHKETEKLISVLNELSND